MKSVIIKSSGIKEHGPENGPRHLPDRPKVNMIVAQAVANVNRKSQRPEIMTFRLLTKDGRPLKVLAKGRLVRDPRDGLVFYVTILDMATDLLADQAVASKD
ncbi:MAG: hypothetical protein ACI4VD_07520 [Limosilactobacillus mucosae]